MFDFDTLPNQNATPTEAEKPRCSKCERPPAWVVLNNGAQVTIVCTPHKHDYLFRKGNMYKPLLGIKFIRYTDPDMPRFFGADPLHRFSGKEMRSFTSTMNKTGTPLVFERRFEGTKTVYISKGITRNMMEG